MIPEDASGLDRNFTTTFIVTDDNAIPDTATFQNGLIRNPDTAVSGLDLSRGQNRSVKGFASAILLEKNLMFSHQGRLFTYCQAALAELTG